jgi:nucleoside-triphosphatase
LNQSNSAPANLLITGSPGVGKTTLVISLLPYLRVYRPAGFFTREIREGGIRKGFELVSLSGGLLVLSHTGITARERVGKYGVDTEGFRRYIEQLRGTLTGHGVVIFDEIGKMEVLSAEFRELVADVLEDKTPLLANISKKGDSFIEGIKGRTDVALVEITRDNRDGMAAELLPVIRAMIEKAKGA